MLYLPLVILYARSVGIVRLRTKTTEFSFNIVRVEESEGFY
jgi:hypothetical protein